jgi:hypothetical protein
VADPDNFIGDGSSLGTRLVMKHRGDIAVYAVMEGELDSLDHAIARETDAKGAFLFVLGLFVSTLVSWATSGNLGNGIYIGFLVGFGGLSVWFGRTWWREKGERPRLLKRIRQHSAAEIVRD